MDTNILVYAVSTGAEYHLKSVTARSLLLTERWCWSTQVALEFYSVTTRQRNGPILTCEKARTFLRNWMRFPMVSMTPQRLVASVELKEKADLSIWDAAIIVAAQASNATVIYTEDLNNRQRFGTVEILNPFMSV
jgi:predicted nucleic acid-binding protein